MSRTHLITGAGSGIGAAVARALHERGDRLVLVARNAERAEELQAELPGSRAIVADLGDPVALERELTVGRQLPDRLDAVLHVAGLVDLSPVSDLSAEALRQHLDVNLVAPSVLTRAALPALRAAQGLVLFVNSTAGLSANPHWAAYASAKFGLRALADALRAEESVHGLRVSTVYPSRTATPMQEKVHRQEGREYDPSRWLQPTTVAATILHVLDLPADATLPEVTIRPR